MEFSGQAEPGPGVCTIDARAAAHVAKRNALVDEETPGLSPF